MQSVSSVEREPKEAGKSVEPVDLTNLLFYTGIQMGPLVSRESLTRLRRKVLRELNAGISQTTNELSPK